MTVRQPKKGGMLRRTADRGGHSVASQLARHQPGQQAPTINR
jgi:hypothetical protein